MRNKRPTDMGDVVQLSDYRRATETQTPSLRASSTDGLLPVEFAVGFCDREQCLQKISQYGVRAIHVRAIQDRPDKLLYFIGVREAIWLNKKILELEELSDDEISQRIDLIQMMENMDVALLDNLWTSFSGRSSNSEV